MWIHPRLQFTLEIGNNNKLNFLDLTLIKSNNFLIYNWFHKPMSSERYINFHLCHPLNKKSALY